MILAECEFDYKKRAACPLRKFSSNFHEESNLKLPSTSCLSAELPSVAALSVFRHFLARITSRCSVFSMLYVPVHSDCNDIDEN